MLRSRTASLLAAALIAVPPAARANPLGGQVVGGQANIQGQGTKTVTVTQGTQNAIINWNTFNIGVGETTQFIQPNAGAIALNRVIGGLGPSEIYGHLKANGRIFLVNPNGVIIGSTGVISTAGFLASTNDIRNADFMAGNYKFNIPGRLDASIVNLGQITAADGGFAALVAPGVRNAGVITANLGNVALASGNGFTLDFYGDKLITLQVGDQIANKVIDVATGQTLNSLVKNEGVLRANGGQVALTAAAARHVVNSVINNKGVIEANSVGTRNGMIVLGAATAGTKHTRAKQTVKVSGTLSAAGQKTGEKGGIIQITGEKIVVRNAKLDASGQAGGGTVLVGRDLNGSTMLAATSVRIDANTHLDASAKTIGDGGKVVVWSTGATSVAASIYATGGTTGGNGGLVETSGQTVNFTGIHVDTSAPAGASGHWLVDPTNLIVDAGSAKTIADNLATTDITLQTNLDGSTLGPGVTTGGPGDIVVNAAVNWSSTHTLTLNAAHDIVFNASVSAPIGVLSLQAANNINAIADVKVGTFTLQNGNWAQVGSLPAFSANDFRLTGGTFLRAASGNGSAISPYEIVDVYGLQGIGSPSHLLLDKSFALGAGINASATLGWNNGAGFIPIGDSQHPFVGNLDGQAHVIDGLTINSSTLYTGLFGFIGTKGAVNGTTLTNVQINATQSDSTFVGALAGWNEGQIAHSSATGTVSAGSSHDTGGLVGRNIGTIAQSSADVAVNGGSFSDVGGLVGTNLGVIFQSFSVGSVNAGAQSFTGGLVGLNFKTIDQSYAAGAVNAPGTAIGGLLGRNAGSVTSSYWDTQVSTQNAGAGTNFGTFQGTGLTTAQSLEQSSYVGFNFGPNDWSIINGQTRPAFTLPPSPTPPTPPSPSPPNNDNTTPSFTQQPPPYQQVAAPTFTFNNNVPIQINLATGGSGAPGGAAGGSGGSGAKPNYGPSPGPGLDRTADEQQYSGVPPPNETRFRSGEVVIQVLDTIPIAQVVQIAEGLGMTLISSQPLEQTHRILYRFHATATADIRALILAFEKNNLIASAEPNYLFGLAQNAPASSAAPAAPATPAPTKETSPDLANSDTAALQSLPAGDAGQYVIDKFHLGAVHRLASGRNVTIAVIDSEIDVAHPDLRGVIAERFDATQSPSKPHAHGTGMAGAIASHTRLLGVAPGARIVAIKTFDDSGSSAESTSYQIIKGLDFAISKNVRIINMSFAGPRDPMMERTLKSAHDKRIILIAAAGNAGPKSPPLYPGADPSVIAVSATDYNDKPFAMANRGKYIAVAAPGVDVMVPAPAGGYQLTTGTSVAAAHVSGVVALLVERKPTIGPDEIRALLIKTATAFSARPKGEEDGAGLVDPVGALQAVTSAKTSEVVPTDSGPSPTLH
jgi:filamentous hemagglutinin family protein